jgi:transaldolase
VSDSGDFASIAKYKPQDATTNPSLILAASKKAEYAKLIDNAVAYGKAHGKSVDEQVDSTLDALLVEFGSEILKIVPGKVSTEVDAKFSFDIKASVDKALHIIDVSQAYILKPNHVLITVSCTRRRALTSPAFSSSSLQRGRVSRPPRSCSPSTASTAT